MHQMRFERIRFSVGMIFARCMEMELLEFEPVPVDRDAAAGRSVDLNGVSVVEDFLAAALVIENDGLHFGFDETGQIDGRLIPAGTGEVIGADFAQFSGPALPEYSQWPSWDAQAAPDNSRAPTAKTDFFMLASITKFPVRCSKVFRQPTIS